MKAGITIIEVLVVVAVVGILAGIAALELRPLHNEAQAAANDFAGTVRQARARAMVTTSAYRVVYAAQDRVLVEWRTSHA